MAEKTVMISVRMPAWMRERLREEAFTRRSSQNELINKVIAAWFRHEDAKENAEVVPEAVRELPQGYKQERKESQPPQPDDETWMD